MSALAELAAAMGVQPRYTDTTGTVHETRPETAAALLAAMGRPAASEAEAAEALAALRAARQAAALPRWQVVEAGVPGQAVPCRAAGDAALVTEDGAEHALPGGDAIALPALPLGLHRLQAGGSTCTLISAPARLPLPAPRWGVTLPLYGLRPPAQGGIGGYDDLAVAARVMAERGAAFVGLNPVHAGFPAAVDLASPYSPSSRRRLATLHVAAPGENPLPGDFVDYPACGPARLRALREEFEAGPPPPAFHAFLADQGEALRLFAVHQALSDRFGPFWTDWPASLHDPDSPQVAAFAEENAREVTWHAWLQWRADTALGAAAQAADAMSHGLYLDLAVGTHPAGAETWAEPAMFARGVSLGAPPDAFSADGQSWGLAPMIPDALEETGFAALAETLRAQFRHARLLRVDHILGFDRAFWVPEGDTPGAYVAMPRAAMLAVARLEAARAGATIVGEDLGNVPEGLRAALADSGILGCAVAQFERDAGGWKPAHAYGDATLASFGTHDLPTYQGWRQGRDIAARAAIGGWPDEATRSALHDRAQEVAGFDATVGGDTEEAVERFLAATPARLVALQIEDILGLADQPNLPGTTDEYPNWRRRLPLAPADLAGHPGLARAARIMAEAGRKD